MKVIIIKEDNHGFIGIAASMTAAKRFLLATDWVNAYTSLYVEEREDKDGEHWFPLIYLYGENWKEAYMGFDTNLLANMGFYFREVEVYKEEE